MEPNGRDYTTDRVLARLAALDRANLALAANLRAPGPHTGGFQSADESDDDEDDRGNQGHIPGVTVSALPDAEPAGAVRTDPVPPTEEQHMSIALDSGGMIGHMPFVDPPYQS